MGRARQPAKVEHYAVRRACRRKAQQVPVVGQDRLPDTVHAGFGPAACWWPAPPWAGCPGPITCPSGPARRHKNSVSWPVPQVASSVQPAGLYRGRPAAAGPAARRSGRARAGGTARRPGAQSRTAVPAPRRRCFPARAAGRVISGSRLRGQTRRFWAQQLLYQVAAVAPAPQQGG